MEILSFDFHSNVSMQLWIIGYAGQIRSSYKPHHAEAATPPRTVDKKGLNEVKKRLQLQWCCR